MDYHVIRRPVTFLVILVQMLTALRGDSRCETDLDTCPPGHQVSVCPSGAEFGFYCEKCSDKTYQPDINKYGDRCRFRKSCRRQFMRFRDIGSTIRDADCMCKPGYHFENEDQRACVPNTKCAVGYGQGDYGVCEKCFLKGGFSDVNDRVQRCQKLSQCSAQGRCLVKPSDGTFDNQCSSIVEDISKCSKSSSSIGTSEGIIIGCVLGIVIIIVVAFVLFLYKRNYRRRYKSWLNGERTDDVIRALIEMSRKDNAFTSNVLEKSCVIIEERIPKQEWALARQLFVGHQDSTKYEDLLVKYKGQTQQESTRAYLEEWRQWKGDNPESIAILFQCLRKCDRDDIVETICKQFRHETDVELNSPYPVGGSDQSPKYNLWPCKKSSAEQGRVPTEETKPLQSTPEVTIQYPDITGPSAPITADSYNVGGSNSNLTFPVQATTS